MRRLALLLALGVLLLAGGIVFALVPFSVEIPAREYWFPTIGGAAVIASWVAFPILLLRRPPEAARARGASTRPLQSSA